MPPPPLPLTRSPIQMLTQQSSSNNSSSDISGNNSHDLHHLDGQMSPTISFSKLSLLSPVNPSALSRSGCSPFFPPPSHDAEESVHGSQPQLQSQPVLVDEESTSVTHDHATLNHGESQLEYPSVILSSSDPVQADLQPGSLTQPSAEEQQQQKIVVSETKGAITSPAEVVSKDTEKLVDASSEEPKEQHVLLSDESAILVVEEEAVRSPTPPPPPKVKLSLKDFAMRKRKQREEESVKASVVVHAAPDDSTSSSAILAPLPDTLAQEDGYDSQMKIGDVAEPPQSSSIQSSSSIQTLSAGKLSNTEIASVNGTEPASTNESSPRLSHSQLEAPKSPPHSASLQAKVELIEPHLNNGFVVPVNDYHAGIPLQPEPPPPSLADCSKMYIARPAERGPSGSPPSPSPPKTVSRKPLSSRDIVHAQEDGEILSSPPPPLHQKPPLAPRSHTPPTHPRSFHAVTEGMSPPSSGMLSPSMPPPNSVRRPLQPAPYRTHLQNQAPPSAPPVAAPPRLLPPSGPRALRAGGSRYSSHLVPRGPSADRERGDWERERSWISSSRGRGRGSSGNWGR